MAEEEDEGVMSDEKFDQLFAGLQRWSAEERTRYCEGLDEHPLFLSQSPSQAQTDSNTYLSALHNIEYDEHDTPLTMATEAKEKGNAAFAKGAAFFGHAIKHYNDCIDHATKGAAGGGVGRRKDRIACTSLLVAAYSNLAAIYLQRRKFISALDCCEQALRRNPQHAKALFRAAKACLETGRAAEASAFCERGMASLSAAATPAPAPAASVDSGASESLAAASAGSVTSGSGSSTGSGAVSASSSIRELAAFRELAAQASATLRRQEANRREVERRRSEMLTRVRRAREAVTERGVAVGPPLYRKLAAHLAGPAVDPVPAFDEEHPSLLNWPVLLLYPEHHTADFVASCPEVASIADLLATVLPTAQPAAWSAPPDRLAWDSRCDYWLGGVDVFYQAGAASPLPVGQAWADVEAEAVTGSSLNSAGESDEADGTSSSSAITAAPKRSGLYKSTGTEVLIRVPLAAPLLLPLVQRGNTVADIPVFYVIPRGSPVYMEYQSRAGGAFKTLALPPDLAAATAGCSGPSS